MEPEGVCSACGDDAACHVCGLCDECCVCSLRRDIDHQVERERLRLERIKAGDFWKQIR